MSSIFARLNDDGKLKRRFYNKQVNAAKEGIPFMLSPKQFMRLMTDAGLVSSDLGIKLYHLARYNDVGPYSIGNCRFLWYLDNYAEKKLSAKSRRASSRTAKTVLNSPEIKERALAALYASEKWHKYLRKRWAMKLLDGMIRKANLNPSYAGERNSQYGSFWVTNGVENRKCQTKKLPKGFWRGRTC